MEIGHTRGNGARIAIMQPYFFPYVGYFSLIKHTDRFILFDPVQFIRHGWIERNRVLKEGSGWLYVRVPLLPHSRATLIRDIRVDTSRDWKRSIFSQLEVYKKRAPYYADVMEVVRAALAEQHGDIVSVNRSALETVCDYLNIDHSFDVFSSMGLEIAPAQAPDEWALNICIALGGVAEYWNPPGGREFFDRSKYDRAGIRLGFQSVRLREYDQGRECFEPALSIIDVMMFNSPVQVNEMLDDYVILEGIDRAHSNTSA